LKALAERAAGTERVRLLAEALDAVDGALEVYDPEHMSYNHTKATALRADIVAAMEGDGGA
jgi:hypothetical protein